MAFFAHGNLPSMRHVPCAQRPGLPGKPHPPATEIEPEPQKGKSPKLVKTTIEITGMFRFNGLQFPPMTSF
jgi:hypothetical protein